MIALLSPAKNIDESPFDGRVLPSVPLFAQNADHLALQLGKFNVEQLMALYKVSRPIAEINAFRYATWQSVGAVNELKPALFAFNGEVYRGFDAKTLHVEQLAIAQAGIRILSGLYGVLKPLDAIRPYRLEMGTAWGPDGLPSLYRYWGDSLTKVLTDDLEASSGDKVLVNLASAEYFKAIDTKNLGHRVLHIDFKQEEDGKLKNITVYAKKARGMMARFIVENTIDNIEHLKAFTHEGYFFDNAQSSADKWVFVR